MIWICIIIFFLGVLSIGALAYIGAIRQYNRENHNIKFSHWLKVNGYGKKIASASLFWVIYMPVIIIRYLQNHGVDKKCKQK